MLQLFNLHPCSLLPASLPHRAGYGSAGCLEPGSFQRLCSPLTLQLHLASPRRLALSCLCACLAASPTRFPPFLLISICSSRAPSLPFRIVPQYTECLLCLHRHFSRPPPLQFCLSFSLSAKTIPKDSLPYAICSQLVSLTRYILVHPGGGTAPSLW